MLWSDSESWQNLMSAVFQMRENIYWVGFVPFYFLFFFFLFSLEADVILDGICSLPHYREYFLMHFDKRTFSWKAEHLLLHGCFRMKRALLFTWANPRNQTLLPPRLLPSSLQREWLWHPEGFQLKDSQVAGTPLSWHVPSSGGPTSLLGHSKEILRLLKMRTAKFQTPSSGEIWYCWSRYSLWRKM